MPNQAPVVTITPPLGVPVGAETLVSTSPGTQQHGAITSLAGGGYVVAWGDLNEVYFQRYASSGVAQGAETRINTTTNSTQQHVSVTGIAGGGFVATWDSVGLENGYGIYSQRYAADGTPLGVQTRVNTATNSDQFISSVAGLSAGGYVVAWTSWLQDGSLGGIYAQRFDGNGVAQGVETRVNSTTANSQSQPIVAGLSGGGYVVVWGSENQDGSGYGAYMQRYSAAGVAQGVETRVNSTIAGDQFPTGVVALGAGYVVVWNSEGGQDGSGKGVYLQRFAANGTAIGSETRVNTTTAGDQEVGRVAATPDGGFVVTWDSAGQDGSSDGIYAQRYDSNGVPQGGEILVNTTTQNAQQVPVVAALADGYVIAWQGNGPGDLYGIFSKRFGRGFSAIEQTATDLKGSLSVADADAGAGTMTATLSVNYGVLNLTAGGSGATVVSGNGTGSVVISGTLAQINALLNGDATSTVTFTPNTDAPPSSATLTLSVLDSGTADGDPATGSASQSIAIAAVEDAPSGSDSTILINEDTPRVLTLADFGFTDADGDGFLGVKFDTAPTGGTLYFTLPNSAPVAITNFGNGFIFQANDIASGWLSFAPAPNLNGPAAATVTFAVVDNSGTPSNTDPSPNTITFDVTAVNDAPINSVPAGTQTFNEGGTLTFNAANGNLISVSDVDLGTGNLSVSLTVQSGTLTLSGTAGLVSVTGNGSNAVTLEGTQAAINAALDGLVYAPGSANDNGNRTITIVTNDLGSTGADPGGGGRPRQ